jgi:uncharacterized protein with HEPN domain
VIAHGYDSINPHRIVATIAERIPLLISEVDELLALE